jgi:hypothetical protein
MDGDQEMPQEEGAGRRLLVVKFEVQDSVKKK